MSKVRRVLKHLSVETAKKRRRCRRDSGHQIAAGEACLVVRDEATLQSSSYCRLCALGLLKLCAADLRTIRDLLYPLEEPEGQASTPPRPVAKRRVTIDEEGLRVEVYDAPTGPISKVA